MRLSLFQIQLDRGTVMNLPGIFLSLKEGLAKRKMCKGFVGIASDQQLAEGMNPVGHIPGEVELARPAVHRGKCR